MAFVNSWGARYPVKYDHNHNDPYIAKARSGDVHALTRVTEWKNVGVGPRPMPLSSNKHKSLQHLLAGLSVYLAPGGNIQFRRDFQRRAPVYGPFWHHVLYDTPIFDVYTHGAWQFDVTGNVLSKAQARITLGKQWALYDAYCAWFEQSLNALQHQGHTVTARQMDRALFEWGKQNM